MHGALLTIFSLWLCWTDRTPGTLAGGLGIARYMFLLMGFFAFYNGLIYNDMSSTAIELFGKTCYTIMTKADENPEITYATRPSRAADPEAAECVYPFGMDPIWFRTTQEIAVMNSFKMKTSVILGVAQMLLGTGMKGFNAIYHRRGIEFIFVVIPQVLLMLALFGFMDWLIIVKWQTDWEVKEA